MQYGATFECWCHYGKDLNISPCEIERLERFAGTTKPPIKYYICEMNKIFTTTGQRMYFSAYFTRIELAEQLDLVDGMWAELACGCTRERVRLMKCVDGRATITTGWSDTVKTAQIEKKNRCVFGFDSTDGKLSISFENVGSRLIILLSMEKTSDVSID